LYRGGGNHPLKADLVRAVESTFGAELTHATSGEVEPLRGGCGVAQQRPLTAGESEQS
jgi:hypothetical protein